MAKKKLLMIVDDESSMRELVSAIMELAGYEVVTASTGEECMARLKTVRPDLIIMDMMMPGMTGKETVEKIRGDPRLRDIRVLFLTVTTFSDMRKVEIKKLVVIDYILKPFDNEDLLQRVAKALKA